MADEMTKSNHHHHLLLPILLLTLSFLLSTSMAKLSRRELEAAIFALRTNGYNLFGNSIAVSDLSFQIVSYNFTSSNGVGSHGFTFLAPPNSALFSLDMSTDAFTYVNSLRFHVLPRRLSFSDLHNFSLSSYPYLETLAPSHVISVAASAGRVISVDGVRVSFPDLYLRSNIAVHGLDGLLVSSAEEFFHRLDSVAAASPEILSPFAGGSISVPPIYALSPEIAGIPAPLDEVFSGGGFNSISISPIDAFSPGIEGMSTPSPSPSRFPHRDWSSTEFLSPSIWPPIWSVTPAATAGEWPENHKSNLKKKKKKKKKMMMKKMKKKKKKKHHVMNERSFVEL